MSSSEIQVRKNDIVEMQNQLYKVQSRDAQGVSFLSVIDRMTIAKTHNELFDLYRNGKLKIHRIDIEDLPVGVQENLDRVMAEFSGKQRDEALFRLDHMQFADKYFALKKVPRRPEGFAHINKVVAYLRRRREASLNGVHRATIPLKVVSGATAREWYRRWRKSGYSLSSLVPLHDLKGKRMTKLDPEVMVIIANRIRDTYLTPERPPLSLVYDLIAADIEATNRLRITPLDVPSETTVRRWVSRNVTDYEKTFHRHGHRAAQQKYRNVHASRIATQPLELVQLDHTPIDLLAILPEIGPEQDKRRKSKKLVRLWLTMAVCVTTRMVTGWYISTESPSWSSVMSCLQMAIMPKDIVEYGAETPYPVMGFPTVLQLDNGKEMHSNSLKAMAGHGNFELRYCPVRSGNLKPIIERLNGVIARDFVATMPGRTFRDVREKGDHDSAGRAAYTIEEVRKTFGRYIIDIYHNRPHAGLMGKTPLQRWEELKSFGVRLPPTFDELRAITGLVLPRKVTTKGVTFLGLIYQSDELQAAHRRGGHVGKEYTVKADPINMGSILVLDAERGKWLDVPCTRPDLAEGVTVAEWKEIVAVSKRQTAESTRVSVSTLRRVRKVLHDEARAKGNKPTRMTQNDIELFQQKVEQFVVFDKDVNDNVTMLDSHARRRHGKYRAEHAETEQEDQLPQIGSLNDPTAPIEHDAAMAANDDNPELEIRIESMPENDYD